EKILIAGAGGRCHEGPEVFCYLHRKDTYSAGCCVDQDLAAGLDPPLAHQSLPCCNGCQWNGCGFLMRELRWFNSEGVFRQDRILGICATVGLAHFAM